MSDLNRENPSLQSADEPLTNDSTSAGATDDIQIREFLYLDFPKLTSYFAQIREGLPHTKQEVLGNRDRELAKSDETETAYEGEGGVSMGGSEAGPITLSRVLGLVSHIDAKLGKVLRQGGDEVEYSETRYLVETKGLHHEVFAFVERLLNERKLVSFDDDLDSDKPFHKITGPVDIIDFARLIGTAKNYNDLISNFKDATGAKDLPSIPKTKSIAKLLETYHANRVLLTIYCNGIVATTNLDENHLTSSTQFLIDNYGRQLQVNVTVFGLKVGRAYRIEEIEGGVTHQVEEEWPLEGANLSDMARSLLSLNRSMDMMDRFFRIRGDIHLYPLAVFLDFNPDSS